MEMDEANADGANQPGPVIVSVEITPPSVDDRGIGTEKGLAYTENVWMKVDSCANYNNRENVLRNRRALPFRSTKFWLRLIRPWKWRHMRRKVQRSGSERSRRAPSISTACPPSPSLPNLHSVSQLNVFDDELANASTSSDTTALNHGTAACKAANGFHHSSSKLPAEVAAIAIGAEGVQIVDTTAAVGSSVLSVENPADQVSTLPGDTGRQTTDDKTKSSLESDSFVETSTMESSILLEGYVGVEAKEPNLAAKPEKPVLKKPGQPSRLRARKKQMSSSRSDSGLSRGDQLPSHLTDDSDSDHPIEYRDDEHHARSAPSTSRCDEDDEDVPIG
ncbi:hypothetical protein Q1695_008648 [Nippostrongylus brasiliensis]|nr:hypothetical protein Q1695_008648 [Nippostrongylus brasiliensis]